MGSARKAIDVRRQLIRRLIWAQRTAMALRLEPAMKGLELALIATETADADRTPDPTM